jgi:hypothetical protein
MKNLKYLFIVTTLIAFISCADNKKNSEPEVVTVDANQEIKESATEGMPVEFNDTKIAEVYNKYNMLKTALVKTNAVRASHQASELLVAFTDANANESAIEATKAIVDASDIEVQRAAFETVTKMTEKMLDGAIKSGTLYKQYCPMAFNNKGAYWISDSKEIQNPYFGDKMLKCGRVEAEIK